MCQYDQIIEEYYISLLCVAYKISSILLNRLMPYAETTIGDYQCGYHRERSTVVKIFTVRKILEICSGHGKDTRHYFINFKAAYYLTA